MKLTKITNSPIIVEKLKGDLWKLHEDVIVGLHIEDAGVVRLRANKGFVFNFRSGSRWLNTSIPKIDDFAVVWLYHDIFYTIHGFSRQFVDDLMYQGLKLKGLSTWKSWMALQGVKLGGESAWFDRDDDDIVKCHLSWDSK